MKKKILPDFFRENKPPKVKKTTDKEDKGWENSRTKDTLNETTKVVKNITNSFKEDYKEMRGKKLGKNKKSFILMTIASIAAIIIVMVLYFVFLKNIKINLF